MCESSRKALPLKTTNDDLNHNRGLNVGWVTSGTYAVHRFPYSVNT